MLTIVKKPKSQKFWESYERNPQTMRKIIAIAITSIVSVGCASTPSDEVVERAEEAATTIAETTTTTSTTTTSTTTTTTTPGPRWNWDESLQWNADNLVGAPIDPLFQDDIEQYDFLISANGYSVNERYWANYVAIGDVACSTLERFYDLGIEENWNRWEAQTALDVWVEEMINISRGLPGFSTMATASQRVSDEEIISITAAGVRENGCLWIYEFFLDFIG